LPVSKQAKNFLLKSDFSQHDKKARRLSCFFFPITYKKQIQWEEATKKPKKEKFSKAPSVNPGQPKQARNQPRPNRRLKLQTSAGFEVGQVEIFISSTSLLS
jgi:hypothetical protein